jgi:F420-non-reducing hydrogenase iron-sulfur subunit
MASPTALCDLGQPAAAAAAAPYVTVFVCANCARASKTPEYANRSRPALPSFDWPFPVQEVLVSCTGRLQPEHVLKAFESGARLVCTFACREDNCHHIEGSKRCARRVEYVRGILDEVGLGAERLMLFHLPGTAAEDMALSAGRPLPAHSAKAAQAETAAIREAVLRALDTLTPTPLDSDVTEAAEDPYQQVDTSYDDNED